MKLLEIHLTFFTLLYFSNIQNTNGETCKQIISGLLAGQMSTIVPCIRNLGYTNGKERSDNFYCIMKCMLIEAGTLTKEGKVTIRQAFAFILESLPLDIMDKAFAEITKCQKFAKDLVDPNDKHCDKYGPLIGCSINVILNLCK